jgi:hypothetical protein
MTFKNRTETFTGKSDGSVWVAVIASRCMML